MVVEYCPGGDLSFQIANKTTLDEDSARFYIAELVLAVEALHKLNVIYRDLKPENILIGKQKAIASLKMEVDLNIYKF
jgi:protein-serine/threonine kinase